MALGGSVDYSARADWAGLLVGVERPLAEAQIFAIAQVASTGSLPFLGLAVNGDRYWVKCLGNPHGVDSLIAERVVEALARKLDAPMRPSVLVEVPEHLTHDSRLIGSGNQAGIAHGSLLLDSCDVKNVLDSAKRDGNSFRQPRFIALWELCYGEDEQWLYDRDNEEQVWSFDHGYWITGGEPEPLTPRDLEVTLRKWKPWEGSVRGMDPVAFLDVAAQLEALAVADFIDVAASVPVAWGVSDDLLESLAWWLYGRRIHVAGRMRALANKAAELSPRSNTKRGE